MKNSYQQAVKASLLIGGAQVVTILFGIVRTKILAVVLGPAGLGIVDLYRTVTATAASISGCGFAYSGVRQIAEANGSGNKRAIATTVFVLRRISLIAGFAGMVAFLALSLPLSKLTFGDTTHAAGLALISLTLLIGNIGAAQTVVLQGMRRVADLAKSQILGAAIGTVASIGVIYWLGQDGIVLYLIVLAVATVCGSWYYARQVDLMPVHLSWREIRPEVRGMLALGGAFMLSGLAGSAGIYLTRLLIVHRLGMEAVGLYQATWALSGLYVGFVLSAIGTDFYPRLAGVSRDAAACNRLINEQTEVGLLMALPGILCTLVLAPWLLSLFYSKSFAAAGDIIRWHIIGVPVQIATHPLSYLPISMGRGSLYLAKEVVVVAVYLIFLYAAMIAFGLNGLGYYYFGARCAHLAIEFLIARRLTGFRWSSMNIGILFGAAVAVAACLAVVSTLRPAQGVAIGLGTTTLVAIVCVWALQRLLGRGFWSELWHRLAPAKA